MIRDSTASNYHVSSKVFQKCWGRIVKTLRKIKYILLNTTEKECRPTHVFFSSGNHGVHPRSPTTRGCYWDPVSSVFLFLLASLPSPSWANLKAETCLSAEQAKPLWAGSGMIFRSPASTQQHVCDQWPLCGTYPSASFSGLQLINSIIFSDEISSHANISDRH